jgi:lipoate---protein ligase
VPDPAVGPPGWSVVHLSDSAGALHHRVAAETPRTVTLCRATRPAIVLGSTQPDSDVDRERAAASGLEITRRRTGGGAVLVEPDGLVWAEVYISREDPLWVADVGRAFWWIGQAWAETLAAVGAHAPHVHTGRPSRMKWASRVCFAGVGPGEVTVADRKAVGMSQRRTRAGALFQCAALLRWEPRRLLDVLALDQTERASGERALTTAAIGLGPDIGVDELERRLVEHLP